MTWGEQNTEIEAFEQLDWAVHEAGINFIDTAELYPVPPRPDTAGSTEVIIGKWLAKGGPELREGGPELRKKIILASKVAGYSKGRGYLVEKRRETLGTEMGDASSFATHLSKVQIFEAVDASLKRLQTTYLDLYQLHWPERYTPVFGELSYKRAARPERYTPVFGELSYKRASERADAVTIEEQVAAIGELVKSGKVRYWGLSNENAFGVTKFVHACEKLGVPLPVSIQNDFAFVDRRFEQDGTAEACAPHNVGANGIGLLAYGALAGGTLSGKYADAAGTAQVETSRHAKFPDFQPRYHANSTLELSAEFAKVAKKYGLKPAQLALAWAAAKEYMGSVIIAATTMQQLKENVAAFDVSIPEECATELEKLYLNYERPYFANVGRMGRNNP
eukprot:CAMPEP_0173128750 /NCGR_PEP_ID=MMETSP1102-20130122/58737_1 /TAXON_ID=49646 /ORGANISM="Geminigera sp., Strain Caron Lab Isolate" /LENGTH=391 /DNA_ID=CAMNT_0014038947 /DNA_START=119 /DNA_END=1295 /DNA_ORIENTATION=+